MSETPSKAVLRLQSSIKQLQILKGSATAGELAQSFALDIETHELALAEITSLRAQLDEAKEAVKFASESVAGLAITAADLRSELAEARRKAISECAAELRGQLWQVVYLDGRNEYGSHVLPMPGNNIGDEISEELLREDAERILSDAEAKGHAVGHCVVTLWHQVQYGDGPEVSLEYFGIGQFLTHILCGEPEEQSRALLSESKS